MNRRDWERWFPEDRVVTQRPNTRRKASPRIAIVLAGIAAFFILASIGRESILNGYGLTTSATAVFM